jgi:hypothetical protein
MAVTIGEIGQNTEHAAAARRTSTETAEQGGAVMQSAEATENRRRNPLRLGEDDLARSAFRRRLSRALPHWPPIWTASSASSGSTMAPTPPSALPLLAP